MSHTIGNDCKYDTDDDEHEEGCDWHDSGETMVSLEGVSSPAQEDDRMKIDCDCDMLFNWKLSKRTCQVPMILL